jgi:hypothetical protein
MEEGTIVAQHPLSPSPQLFDWPVIAEQYSHTVAVADPPEVCTI